MNNPPRLAYLLSATFMEEMVEKTVLRKRFIRVPRMLSVSTFLFENGALLGSAYRDHLDEFVIPYCAGERNTIPSVLPEEGRRIAAYQSKVDSIQQLFMVSEMNVADPLAPMETWPVWLGSKSNQRVTPEFAVQMGCIHSTLGVAYGAFYPDGFADLYDKSYGNQDAEAWRRWYELGLVIEPEPPPFVPFETRRADAVEGFLKFCREYFPEYVGKLAT